MNPLSDIDRLLAQDAWIRRMARHLTADPHSADDLVQEAWVVALERPRATRSPRAWFGGVLRNVARQVRRGETRRQGREQRVARQDAAPGAPEVVEEMSLRKNLAEALLDLEEPYRTTLFLRFFRDLSVREIAELQHSRRSTVHDRLQRGLELVRERLDERYDGDRKAWLVALLPLSETGLSAAVLGGSLAMNVTVKIALSVALVGGAVGLWMETSDDRSSATPKTPQEPSTAAVEEGPLNGSELAARGAESVGRAPLAPQTEAAPPAVEGPAEPPATTAIEGRVVDPEGRPLEGLAVGLRDSDRDMAHSDGAGRFRVEATEEIDPFAEWTVRDRTYGTLVPGQIFGRAQLEVVIVAARLGPVAGRVVDLDGRPIVAANLALGLDQELFRRLGIERPFAFEPESWKGVADEDGRFRLDQALAEGSQYMVVTKQGYREKRIDLEAEADRTRLRIQLEPESAHEVWGRVVHTDGSPAPGAQVSLGGEIVVAAEDGAFRLTLDEERIDQAGSLMALKRGFLPARMEYEARGLVSPVLLQLGDAPAVLHGRVVDTAGEPLEGIVVWVTDPTMFGRQRIRQGELSVSLRLTVEEALRGGFGQRGAHTGPDGTFELDSLQAREYELGIFEPSTMSEVTGLVARAGTGAPVEFVLNRGPVGRVAGRVLSLSGEPLEGIELIPARSEIANLYSSPPISSDDHARATTDAEGRFEFPSLALENTHVALLDGGFQAVKRVLLANYDDLERIEIQLPRTCELRVELSDPSFADRMALHDVDNQALRITESFGIFMGHDFDVDLEEGRSSLLQVDERATTLVLYLGEDEVARRPLRLTPGETTVIEL